jgi:glutamate/tyrosine decarboxylase-like PLP-dependent enzyme
MATTRKSALPASFATRLCQYIDSLEDRSAPVVRLASPDAIRAEFEKAGVSLALVGEEPCAEPEALAQAMELLLQYSVRTGHPLFFNQLYARANPVAIAADWVSAATNTNCHTYEVAPVYTLMESAVLAKLASVVGGGYANSHDGLFVPGGSLSNLYGMHLARCVADPDHTKRGAFGGPRFVAFTSDQSHYSYLKSARLTGLGSDNLVDVETDSQGRMLPKALESAVLQAKENGGLPFFVGSTAGTTVIGAYDPFEDIQEVCERHGLWHHVDACWGGSAMLSEKHRHLMSGVERADSLAWNPHKMMGSTLQCSTFVTRHAGILAKTNGTNAAYLFQPDKENTEMDTGDKTIQCGRKTDMFKLWLMWKASGDIGMRKTVDRCFELASLMAGKMRNDPSGAWQLVYEPSCSNVCFWYVPESQRPFGWETATPEQIARLNKVAPLIKAEMQRTGNALIGYQAVNGRPNFFRMVFASADTVTENDVSEIVASIARIGEDQCRLAGV